MDIDYDKQLEQDRQRWHQESLDRAAQQARKKAHKAACNALDAQALADQLTATLGLGDIKDLDALAQRLNRQAHTLDAVFFTSLHQAGLGFEHQLQQDPTQIALTAQRQCRQTFDSLKSLHGPAHSVKTGKQNEEPQK